jgi:beta-glucanase (GH16 family)
MKKIIFIYVISVCTECCCAQQNLIMDEEFSGAQLNTTLWQTQEHSGPNINADDDLQVFMPNKVVVNNGLKLYLDYDPGCYFTWRYPTTGCTVADAEVYSDPNCTQSDIVCSEQGDHCLCKVPRHFDYIAGMIFSKNTYMFGTFEMKCKIPLNTWPAFWLYGEQCEEIDIFEFLTCGDATKFSTTVHKCPTNSSVNKDCGHEQQPGPDYSQDFHTFRLEWTSTTITFLVDGVEVPSHGHCNANGLGACIYDNLSTGSNCNPGVNTLFPNHPMNVIVNLAALSGCTPLHAEMDIQYIKVWSDVAPHCNTSNINIHGGTSSNPLDLTAAGGVYPQTLRVSDYITTSNFMKVTDSGNDPDVYWSAANYIEINPGFETEEGATFTAEIAPCNTGNRSLDSADNHPHLTSLSVQTIQNQQTLNTSIDRTSTYIFPNPSRGVFTLSTTENVQSIVVIYNTIGQIVYEQSFNSKHRIDLSSQPKGIYFIKVQSPQKVYTEKVVVQ